MTIPAPYSGETAIIAGTGLSLTPESIAYCNEARKAGKARIFAANRAHELFDCDVLAAINSAFYPLWWDSIKDKHCDKWTTSLGTSRIPAVDLTEKYPEVQYIDARLKAGLSKDPSYVHYHHTTGAMLINIAYLYGCTRLILIGFDMRYQGKVNDTKYNKPRRYLGEDAITQKHWMKTDAKGDWHNVIPGFKTINPADYGIEIINCTPDSALRCFPMMNLDECGV